MSVVVLAVGAPVPLKRRGNPTKAHPRRPHSVSACLPASWPSSSSCVVVFVVVVVFLLLLRPPQQKYI
jgi:hypothetical protein